MPKGCPQERRGSILEHPGPNLGNLCFVLLYSFDKLLDYFFVTFFFSNHIAVVLETFWRPRFIIKRITFSKSILALPGHPPMPKTIELVEKVVETRGSSFSRRGASGRSFTNQNGPKLNSKATKNQQKRTSEINPNFYPKWIQDEPKKDPKRLQN